MLAASRGKKDAVAALLAAGASLTAKDHSGYDALYYALRSSNHSIIRQLLNKGAKTNNYLNNLHLQMMGVVPKKSAKRSKTR
jgi:ankyrin repeat protein